MSVVAFHVRQPLVREMEQNVGEGDAQGHHGKEHVQYDAQAFVLSMSWSGGLGAEHAGTMGTSPDPSPVPNRNVKASGSDNGAIFPHDLGKVFPFHSNKLPLSRWFAMVSGSTRARHAFPCNA